MLISRSLIIEIALEEFIRRRENQQLLEKINAACDESLSDEEQVLLRKMSRSHRRMVEGEWQSIKVIFFELNLMSLQVLNPVISIPMQSFKTIYSIVPALIQLLFVCLLQISDGLIHQEMSC